MKHIFLSISIFSMALSILIATYTYAYLYRFDFLERGVLDRWTRIVYTESGKRNLHDILGNVKEKN